MASQLYKKTDRFSGLSVVRTAMCSPLRQDYVRVPSDNNAIFRTECTGAPLIKGLEDLSRCTATNGSAALFVLSALGVGGSERKVSRVSSALAEGGVRVALCALGPPYTLKATLHDAVDFASLDRKRRVSPRVIRALRDLIVAKRPRTLIAVDLFALLHASAALKLAGATTTRLVALINTTTFVRRRDRLFMLGYAPLLRRVDLLVFGSSRQRAEWTQRYRLAGTPACVIHNGVDAQRFTRPSSQGAAAARQQLAVPAQRIVLGTVGRLAPEKNQMAMVRALARLCGEGLDVHLLLAGDGPQREAIAGEAAALGVADRLTLAGELDDVGGALAAMDIFVLPSTSVETFSNAALEAMSMQLPVVLTDIGGAREMVVEGREGFIVPTADQAALDQALRLLCTDRELSARMGAAARARVEGEFAFARMVDAYRAIIGAPLPARDARPVTVER